MGSPLHPSQVLNAGVRPFPALAACEHYAGSEKLIRKALDLQSLLVRDGQSMFDVTADCEDGAPAGHEREHAELVAKLVNSTDNRCGRLGARIHDVNHPSWRDDLEIIVGAAGERLAYLVLPKPDCAADARVQIEALDAARARHGITREIPVHVLIETPGALREVWQIAALPHVESIDFGLMDYVSAHHGAIPADAMHSPGQFTHPLLTRAKCEIAAAALGSGIVPAHNVTTEFRDASVVAEDARRARMEFGFLRMWSIHPNQIEPIVKAMRPELDAIAEAGHILALAQDADWGPIQIDGRLHDRASYRYYWELLQRAHATAAELPGEAQRRFFTNRIQGKEAA